MLSIGKLAAGPAAADYFLRRRAGCELDYYAGDGERPGRWCGRGATALGLAGELTPEGGEPVLRHLLDGRAPAGDVLVKPVWRADPRGHVPAMTVLTALHHAATSRNVDIDDLLGDDLLLGAHRRAVRAALQARRRPSWPAPSLPAEVAGRMLTAAGLDPAAILNQPEQPGGRVRDRLAAALRHQTDRVDVRVPGLDLTFSAPKSVSVLYALADSPDGRGNGDVARAVRDAHQTAIGAAVEYLELTCAAALRGHHRGDDTDVHVPTAGLIGAAFEHRTSRLGDPQLHTHVVLANLLHGTDGKWSAVDTRQIYAHARTAGFVYQAVLRGQLTAQLGVAWLPVRNGQAEIAGVPAGLCRVFSKRRQAIDAALAAKGAAGPRAAEAATLATRPRKPAAESVLSLRQRWALEAHDAGYGPADLTAPITHPAGSAASTTNGVAGRAREPRAGLPEDAVAGQVAEALLADDGLTARRSTFDRRDLLRGVCEHLPAGTLVTLGGLRSVATRVLRDPRVVPLLGDAPVDTRRYATSALLSTEAHALELATARADDQLAVLSHELVERARADATVRGLTEAQTAMVTGLLSTGAGVQIVIGPAGSGKTAALAAAYQAWQHAGVPVQGAALAAIAARVLEDGAGIPACSVQRLLTRLDRQAGNKPAGRRQQPPPLPPGGVLVVDEAGMIGTRTLHQLITLTQAHGTKLVLVGDPHQLPEIDAGGLFATLATRLPTIALAGNQRQQHAWEQHALTQLRAGDVLRALSDYAEHDRLRITDTTEALTTRLLTDYQALLPAHRPGQVLVIASSRADTRRLNTVLRELLIADGTLGATELIIDLPGERRRSYRTGEQVIVTANDYPLGLLNGTRGKIEALHHTDRAVTVALDDGRRVRLDADYLQAGTLAHGYALTAHKAQGLTVDVALLWGSAALTRETGYVSMSRGRHANYLYATWDTLRHDTGNDLDRSRVGSAPTAEQQRTLTRAALAERLDRSGRQRLATSWWRPRTARPGVTAPAPSSVARPDVIGRAG